MAVVTISRQFGAGGRTLGRQLATAVNYRFLDDVVIQALAQRINVTHEAVQDIESMAGGFFSKILSIMLNRSYMERLTGVDFGYIDEVIYLKTLKEVIVDLAKKGNVVLLGRGSQYILEKDPNALHVLIVGEHGDRVEFVRKNYNLTKTQAEEAVAEAEKRRRLLYAMFGKRDFNHPSHYHLVLNTSRLPHDEALEHMINLVREFDKREKR
jgi:cytidylate kinase